VSGYASVQEQKQKQLTLVDWDPGPRPWCRVCQRPATAWGYDRYADGFQGFWVRCHGDIMGGLITHQINEYNVLEVFCYNEPHVPNGFWWFIGRSGLRLQEDTAYIRETTVPGFFQSRTAAYMRKYGLVTMMWISIIAGLFFRHFHR